ncbi:hypothetical protein X907_1215 [Glycocaulis alkaliphilus]|uniref:Uncharacterized protein n=1 Tax=Glycocaulis alkaliphilus TaxID=1434191 RepID=A0A3T0E916_9PROT|nr:hypothetical protein X907_1215 [Glycocaulis alkaliphilus]
MVPPAKAAPDRVIAAPAAAIAAAIRDLAPNFTTMVMRTFPVFLRLALNLRFFERGWYA